MEPQALREIYGLSFPESLFEFGTFARSLPDGLLREALGVCLEGPLTVEAGSSASGPESPLWRSRYYNDPPEFVTVLTGDTDGLHWGYYVEDPAAPEFPVASYYSNDAFSLSVNGDDLFEAVREAIELRHETNVEYLEEDPDEAEEYESRLEQLALLRTELQKHRTGDRPETGTDYVEQYGGTTLRKPIAPTRDGMGICVPAELYRALSGDDPFQIWNYVPQPEEVDRMSREALEFLEQGSPGAALKLGKDLWIYQEFTATSYTLLEASYSALGQEWHRRMLQVAREYREFCDAQRARRAGS